MPPLMKHGLLIHLNYCLTPTNTIHNAAIVIHGDQILAIGGFSAFVHTEQYDVIRMPDCYMMPGFVDTHMYGAGGFDCMHADGEQSIIGMSRILGHHGVTSFVPTTQSCKPDRLLSVVKALARVCDEPLPGAVPAGMTVEGPFISMAKRGAHPKQYLRPIDLDEAQRVIDAGCGNIRVWTFAPELEGSLDLIRLLRKHEISPCMGHTVANEEQVRAAVAAGANRCAHLYNGMEPLQQRRVGLAALALTDENIWVELITDGVHIHPGMIDLACRSKSKDKIIGISNSTEAAGLAPGVYKLGDETIVVADGKSTLRGGVLAGSISFLDANYRYMIENTHLTPEEAAACFSLNPARSIGLNDRGEIKPGKRADIVIMNHQHEVQLTISAGKIVYDRNRIAEHVDPSFLCRGLYDPLPEVPNSMNIHPAEFDGDSTLMQ